MRNWLLPEYIEDILPPEAQKIEEIRRNLLDLFRVHGYQLVIPPLLEYTQSLLTGTGHDMDLQTFKVVDQLSGRLMGLRADVTPQATRIDAHLLNRRGITRLCYAASVLHTLPSGMTLTREPIQIGAELFGHAGLESDIEIQQLLLKALQAIGITPVQLDLGHVAIFRTLMRRAEADADKEAELFRALQQKDLPTIKELSAGFDPVIAEALCNLPALFGNMEVIQQARAVLPDYAEVKQALQELEVIGRQLQQDGCSIGFDLAELRGYHYHTGVVFAAYAAGQSTAIALGGRYDEVGKAFGRARPATGFTMELRGLGTLAPDPAQVCAILAAYAPSDKELQLAIEKLRAKGEIVIVDVPGHEAYRDEINYDRVLVKQNGKWQVTAK